MLRLCHHFDMNFGGSWGNGAIIPTADRERYLVSSVMEEAIASSQMEGAATTRRVAKDMLRKNLSPKGRSEQMIYNNYASIKFISEHKDEKTDATWDTSSLTICGCSTWHLRSYRHTSKKR